MGGVGEESDGQRGAAPPAEASQQPEGTPISEATAERMRHGARDMVWSMITLIVIIGAIVGFFGACQFSPGGPTIDPAAGPRVDAGAEIRSMAGRAPFPLREPRLPTGWRASSAALASIGGGDASRLVAKVGWVTPEGRYLRLSQSALPPEQIVADEIDAPAPAAVQRRGEVDVGGRPWAVYQGRGAEQAWVGDVGGARVLVTGSGTPAELATLAAAAQQAPPL